MNAEVCENVLKMAVNEPKCRKTKGKGPCCFPNARIIIVTGAYKGEFDPCQSAS
jgi:hypothetical protein